MQRILIVDDDELSAEFLTEAVRDLGHRAETAHTAERAIERVAEADFDLVITDLRMPGKDGLELIAELSRSHPGLGLVLVTAHGSVESAVEAMRLGAADFMMKPVSPETLGLVLDRVARTRRLENENAYLRSVGSDDSPQLIARSAAMRETLDTASRIAASRGTVLITGESGTGKERIAAFIHENSPRKDAAFVRVNCAALSEQLLESELFGHERGAFTGAHRRREGRFEIADGGTLLLDEIGEMSPNLQAKLLRVLQEQEFERVGGTTTLQVDVRVIASTNRNLPVDVAEGRFREDLYYRLHVLPLHLAPLSARAEDILPLAEHFARHYARTNGLELPEFNADAQAMLTGWDWPGNVRELENVVQRAVILSNGESIDSRLLSFGPAAHAPRNALSLVPTTQGEPELIGRFNRMANRTLSDIEREAILSTLEATGGNKTEAARRMGVTARTLSNKMKLWRELGLVA